MGGDEVLQHAHALLEVGQDGVLDGKRFGTCLLGLGHQATHAGQLADLAGTTTGTGVKHHVYGIETVLGLAHGLHQYLGQVVVDLCPSLDNLIVTLLVGDEAHTIVHGDALDFIIASLYEFGFLLGHDDIAQVE